MAYATSEDMLARYDANTLGDLCSAADDGTPELDLASSPRMTAALEEAAGRIQAACFVSRLYSAEDLAALTGSSLALLVGLNCQLAMAQLMLARPEKFASEGVRDFRKDAETYLEMLRKGERLFDLAAPQDAGLPTIDGPTALEVQNQNLITTRTRNYYPSRASSLPIGRGY